MIYQLLEDLRFVIGLLFFLMSSILLFEGLANAPLDGTENLNLLAGSVMFLFSLVMLVFAWRGRHSDNHK